MSTESTSPVTLHRRLHSVAWHITAIVVSIVFVLPLFWTLSVSLREIGQPLPRTLEWIPDPLSLDNYRSVFDVVRFARFTLNSLIVAAIAAPITVATASMAGFAMAQLSHRWRMRLTGAAFVAMMIPLTAVWLPRFVMIKEAGLIDSRWSLIYPSLFGTSPFFVLLFHWTFRRVPQDVYDSARLDGADPIRVWAQIAFPLAHPTAAAVAVLAFVRYWSSFVEPLLYIQSESKKTLPLGLQALVQLDRTNWPLLMAGAVMVTAPVIIVFLVAQRAFLRDRLETSWLH